MNDDKDKVADAIASAGHAIAGSLDAFADQLGGEEDPCGSESSAGQIAGAIQSLGSGQMTPGPLEAIAMGLHAGDGLDESLADKVGETAMALDRIADALEGIGSAIDCLADAVKGKDR